MPRPNHARGSTSLVPAAVAAAGCWLSLLVDGCSRPTPPPRAEAGPVTLHDMTDDTGITFRHTDGSSGQRYIVESVSAGLALFDLDGDGLSDVYFLNGAPLRGTQVDTPPTHALYRNEGNWHFRDVSAEAGVADRGYGLGVTVGDYDNDGFPDLYLNNYGPNVLYHNNGDGTFAQVTDQAGVGKGNTVGAGTCFLDADNDGDLDLYVANYVDFTYENHVPGSIQGLPAYSGPRYYRPLPAILYRNNGDGTFTDISRESGIGGHAGSGMGAVCGDYDNDGDTDIFVGNDSRRNFLFRNDGTGKFDEVALEAGVAYNYFGDATASMGADCGDFDNDGWLDLYVTDYAGELPVLFQNAGRGLFHDVTRRTRAGLGALPHITWGVGMVDFNNDGHRDLYLACGHLDDNVELRDDRTAYRLPNILLLGSGRGTFDDISDQAGDGMRPCHSSRGAAFDDLDNDGKIDVVVQNSRERPTVLRNATSNGHHWSELVLRGVRANADGVGSRVQVTAGDLTQIAEVHSGRGYQSHFGTRLHFGFGTCDRIDRLEVRWLGGGTDVIADAPVDCRLVIIEGRGRVETIGPAARQPHAR